MMKTNLIYVFMLAMSAIIAPSLVHAQSGEEDFSAIVVNKNVTETGLNQYSISLEAFVTGQQIIEHKPSALDIALVLDASYSMHTKETYDYQLRDSQGYKASNTFCFGEIQSGSSNTTTANKVYYSDEDGNYCVVCLGNNYNNGTDHYYLFYDDTKGVRHYLDGTSDTTTMPAGKPSTTSVIWTGVLYERKSVENLVALKNAVNRFLEMLNADPNDLKHNVAIVRYANSSYKTTNHLTAYTGNGAINSTTLVSNFVDISNSANLSNLKTYVNNITTDFGAATAADYGMTIAKELFDQTSYKDDNRPKVVVMFTDGEPNHGGDDFDGDVANATIQLAKSLKDNNVKVFTVGLFKSFFSDDSNQVKYLQATSSNYPSATDYNITVDEEHNKNGFFTQVTDASALLGVFEDIAQVTIEGGADIGLTTATTTVIDVVAPNFKLPDGANASMIKLSAVKCNGVESTGFGSTDKYYKFDEEHPVTGDDFDAMFPDVEITVEGKEVDVRGFDFSSNFVGDMIETLPGGSTTHTYHGYKLVIEFPIVIDPDSPGGALVATNTEKSGLWADLGDGKGFRQVKPFPVPFVKIPNIVVIQKGLLPGESATFKVIALDQPDATPFELVCTQQKGKEYAIARIKIQKPGRYAVVQTGWSWAYKAPTCQASYDNEDTGVSTAQWNEVGFGPADQGYLFPIPTTTGTEVEGYTIIRNVNDFTEAERKSGATVLYTGTEYIFDSVEKEGNPAHAEANINNEFNVLVPAK